MANETVRAQVAAHIKADLTANYVVRDYPVASPDNISANKVHVSVYRTELSVTAQALTHTLEIDVLVGGTNGPAEDNLDDALDDVLLSLQRMDGVTATSAQRMVFGESFIGYKIAADVASTNVYRAAVIQERAN